MIKKIFITILCLSVVYINFMPINVEAITLKEYEDKVAQYKKEAQENQNAINKTQSEINSTNNYINSLKNEMVKISNEVSDLNAEIEKYNVMIQDKLLQSKQILEYMQLSDGENLYLEYIFNADSTTELIYRKAVVEELINYNERAVSEMEQIIEDNKKRQIEIDKRKEEINNLQSQLSSKVVSLGEKKASLESGGVTVAEQIKIYEGIVNSYKKLGCKSHHVIGVDCAVSGSAGSFRRPTTNGYVTQEAYYSKNYTHRGIDVGSYNSRSEKIYPIADGRIYKIYKDGYGALCVLMEHYNPKDGKYYSSLYVHLSAYSPHIWEGKQVKSNEYIGYMGDTGKAYGVHLHLEVFPCRLYNWADPNCATWSSYVNFAEKQLKNGYKGPRSVITFPTGLRNSWNVR